MDSTTGTIQARATYTYDGIGNRVSTVPAAGFPATNYGVALDDPTAYSLVQHPAKVLVTGHTQGTLLSGTTPVATLADDSSDQLAAQDLSATATADNATVGDAGSWRRRFDVDNANSTVGLHALMTVNTA